MLHIRAGVPQGSILGPLLVLLFMNDIVLDIESNIRLFADDTSLYIIVDDPVTAANCLNKILKKNQNQLLQLCTARLCGPCIAAIAGD